MKSSYGKLLSSYPLKYGCFWQGHKNCKYFVVPKTRTKWWLNKINNNKANDEKTVKTFKKDGWKVLTV